MTAPVTDAGRWLYHAVEIGITRPHALTFRHPGLTPGNGWCRVCEREITLRQYLDGERCPGREVAP